MKIDRKISADKFSWKFDKKVSKNFSDHAKKSIPFYEISHELVLSLSNFFLKNQSTCYDIGCSTGSLVKKIYNNNKKKKLKIIGIDNSYAMIQQAKKINLNNNIAFYKKNLEDLKFKKSDLIISLYTIQFLQPKFRQILFNKIYKSLNWGGAFIIFEKIRGNDARFQDILTFLHFDFKTAQGLRSGEIINKEISLRSVMEPYTIKANLEFMKRAGFKDIMPICQFLCFKGFLAIK